MIPIFQQKLIQIEITNACINQCANCTRLVGHHKTPFFMDLETVKKAIESLEGYPGHIGIMGGEPTMHPQFREICKLFQELVPDKERRELWTAGYKWDEYKDIIYETFDKERISFNNHSTPDGKHSPMLVAIKDTVAIKDQKEIIDNCWVQPRWSSSITPYGCYFCEVAAAIDIAFKGKNGYPIEKGWWNKTPEQFQDQVNAICYNCGAPIPIGETFDGATYDIVSRSNLKRLKEVESPKIKRGDFALYKRKWTKKQIQDVKNWKPYNWRTFYANRPEDYQGKV
jgi:hypothetical protein